MARGFGRDMRLVKIVETGSGPGGMLYACGDCRGSHSLPVLDEEAAATSPTRCT
ncbi:hypothetical protein [Streptomyces sp. NPDC051776]|uniref:hypothetical protein n=1 Tax=Streptomyces sp. NPDC051776 TaxID=3155414 RepID=UPI00341B8379